ncbi:TetR/AcrR family transcriptional regulator [Amaricoccus macauensis]|uniref:TetR/AcrR family transcriptional regulator n=1 Tax=Amaricoccus macauensis TaxID=57001 RepID=UPI003C7E4BA9
MREDRRSNRRAEIEAAAYEVLAESGFAAASMLSIARRARASNETLYRWYGDKTGLFRALVAGNAESLRAQLEGDLASGCPPEVAMERLGPALLATLLSDRAIALNRAAAADPTDTLGHELAAAGRDVIAPLIADVLARAATAGLFRFDDPTVAAARYIDLLVGDLQIRRATGALPSPTDAEIEARAARALADLARLYPPTRPDVKVKA